jgi:hypothetical protein
LMRWAYPFLQPRVNGCKYFLTRNENTVIFHISQYPCLKKITAGSAHVTCR